ncbi:hypothetical protein ABLE92_12405 [Gordonia sp. VNQ95]|jgi:hypothetical protein|uniref:hypothetical protein n=1 Tax=Gordonia TaxID=2053 RepID=UPI0032B4F3D0
MPIIRRVLVSATALVAGCVVAACTATVDGDADAVDDVMPVSSVDASELPTVLDELEPEASSLTLAPELTTTSVMPAGPSTCGPAPEWRAYVVVTSGELSCPDAITLIENFNNDPGIRRGDHGATVDGWNCNIYGAAEVPDTGYVIKCVRPDGATVTVSDPRRAP